MGRNVALAVALARDGRPHYEIAGLAKVSPSVLSDYKAGRASPTPERARRIAAVLAVDADELFGEQVPA